MALVDKNSAAFRYCPFCGGDLSTSNRFKFCPFCGESLGIREEPKGNHGAVIAEDAYCEYDYYTLVLKYAANKEKLIQRLQGVLLRSPLAIRMAVDSIPSILIYKGKMDDMASILKVFPQEFVSISIIPGDYTLIKDVSQIFVNYKKLSETEKQILNGVSVTMWLGDTYSSVFTVRDKHVEGLLIPSDQNIYFITEADKMVISHYLIRQIYVNDVSLLLDCANGKQYEWIFSERSATDKAYQDLQQMLDSRNKRCLLKYYCEGCGFSVKCLPGENFERNLCEKCGSKLQHKILGRNY